MRDYKSINDLAIDAIQQILAKWLPDGKREGNEYVALNPTRSDKALGSFKINLKTGLWSDFSTSDKGGDLISLIAYLDKVSQSEAATRIEEYLGITTKKSVTGVTNVTIGKSLDFLRSLKVTKFARHRQQHSVTEDEEIWYPQIPVPEDAPLPPATHFSLGSPTQKYVYRDKDGNFAFYMCRFDTLEDGISAKTFSPLTYCHSNRGNKAWRWKSPCSPRILYNLDRLTAEPTKPVIFFEGERCADAGAQLFPGYISTSTLFGAKSPHHTDLSCLTGRRILIWPDNDETGKQYAQTLATLLTKVGVSSIQFINLKKVSHLLIKKPILEKWDAADALAEGYTAADLSVLLNDKEGLIEYQPQDNYNPKAKFRQPHYTIDKKNGVLYHGLDRTGLPLPPVKICSHLEVTALTRNQNSENWGRLLEFDDRDGVHHQFALPMELMSGDGNEYRKELLRLGLEIECGRSNHARLDNYINSAAPSLRAICTEKIGWHKSAFILPNRTLGNNKEHVIFQSTQGLHHHFKQQGTLESWQEKVAKYCVGNSRLIFAVSSAFAAPLLHLLGEESGGFNFVGPSSCGKTTALKVAASVWGSPDYVQRWRATANGLEGIAHMHNDTLLILDELAQVDAKDAGDIAYMLANEQGKVRAQKNGFARASINWRLLFLSAGEVGLSEHMREANKCSRAGQEVRLADIPADAGKGNGLFENLHQFNSGSELSNALTQGAANCFGIAGILWLEILTELTKDPAKVFYFKKLQNKFVEEVLPEGASSQVARVAARMGLIAAAGEYASVENITGWTACAPNQAIQECFLAWLDQRGGAENHEVTQALSQVRAFFEANGESQFTAWDDAGKTQIKTRDRAGFCKLNDQGQTEYYVFTEAYERRICQGLNKREVTKVLSQKGWLKLDKNDKPYQVIRFPEIGLARCYVFTEKLWEGDETLIYKASC